ncbi:Phage integrase family [Novymonas esmeraldas]|uniref:Phage integrase family n=1 Tax=Novymonas esmeraldas TaxID=1808958 RepID=A0AAW0EZZ5_9TRYP
MVRLNCQRVKTLVEKVNRDGVVFFPIFILRHWIAGVLSKEVGTHESGVLLTTYDSAPSTVVEQQLCSTLHSVWPKLRILKGTCPRQERNSNDCGLYMTANFFCHELRIKMRDRRDLPACLRRLLYAAGKYTPPKDYFLEKIRKILVNHPVSRKDFFYDEIARTPWKTNGVMRGGGRDRRRGEKRGEAGRSDNVNQHAEHRRSAAAAKREASEAAAAKRIRREKEKASQLKKKQQSKKTDATRKPPSIQGARQPTPSKRRDLTNPPRPKKNDRRRKSARRDDDDDDMSELTLADEWLAARASERHSAAPTSAQATATSTTKARTTTTTAVPATGPAPASNTHAHPRTNAEVLGREVASWAEETLTEARRHARRVYEGVLDHLWAATALAMCGDGVSRGLGCAAIGMQRVRHKLPELQPYSVQEMLRMLGKHVHVMDARAGAATDDGCEQEEEEEGDARRMIFRAADGTETTVLDPLTDEYYLVRGPRLGRMPESVSGFTFVMGARLREAPEDMDGVRFPSYYALTRVAAESTVGVYVPTGMTHYSASKPQRASRHASRYVPLPRSQRQTDQDNEEEETSAPPRRRDRLPDDGDDNQDCYMTLGDGDTTATVGAEEREEDVPGNRRGDGYADVDAHISDEATRALADIRAMPLNMQGRPLTGPEEAEVCPRNWFLFAGKPPHISQLAWSMVRPDTRSHHLRWLTRIKCMPTASLQMSLPAACIDLILATARARRWKWATTAKAFAGVAGSLRDLPLYSTQRRGIRLQDDPEWRSAFGTVQRFMKESVPDAPPFVTLREVRAVLARLKGGHARAALFLAMMWGFAARAGDISALRCKDVTIFRDTTTPSETHADDTGGTAASVLLADGAPGVRVSLTVRRGKGTKKRGPYPIPSVLTRELAATLQQMLAQRRPAEELFAPYKKELRKVVAFELGKEKRGAQLPSVRKGALRCMADAGVPIKDLMTLSGHTKHATLLRYLGYGQQPTVEAETARANASRALFPTR